MLWGKTEKRDFITLGYTPERVTSGTKGSTYRRPKRYLDLCPIAETRRWPYALVRG